MREIIRSVAFLVPSIAGVIGMAHVAATYGLATMVLVFVACAAVGPAIAWFVAESNGGKHV